MTTLDEELLDRVSEFQLDYHRQIYMRLFGDYWVMLRGYQSQLQLWSKEHKEWQTGDALQDKFLYSSPAAAWEDYKRTIRDPTSDRS